MERITLRAVAARLWILVLGFLLLCHLNHSRYWWQESVCSFSLYWLPFVVFGGLLSLGLAWRRSNKHRLTALLASGVALALTGAVVRLGKPYIYFSSWPVLAADQIAEFRVLFVPVDADEVQANRIDMVVSRYLPDIVVVMGEGIASLHLGDRLAEYSFHRSSRTIEGRTVRIASRFALSEETQIEELGFSALPAMYVKLEHPVGGPFEFGALQLVPPFSAKAFEDNTATSRRLATLVRNSSLPRIVVGSFFSSEFSQIVSMYTRQGRLRSVNFGHGLVRTWNMHNPLIRIAADHSFVSRHFALRETRLVRELKTEHLATFFRVALKAKSQILR